MGNLLSWGTPHSPPESVPLKRPLGEIKSELRGQMRKQESERRQRGESQGGRAGNYSNRDEHAVYCERAAFAYLESGKSRSWFPIHTM